MSVKATSVVLKKVEILEGKGKKSFNMDIGRENDLSVSAQINYMYKIYWFCPKNKSFFDFMNIITQLRTKKPVL